MRNLISLSLIGFVFVQMFIGSALSQDDDASQDDIRPVDISQISRSTEINGNVWYLLESTGPLSLEDVMAGDRAPAFRQVETVEPDFGYITEGIWLKTRVENSSPDPLKRYLMIHTNFMSRIEVYLRTGGGIVLLLEQDQSSVFGSRPVPYHELVAPFVLDPGEVGEIFIRYESNGDTVLPLSLVDEVGLAVATNERLVVDFSFYGIMLMFILAAIFGRIFFPNPTFVAYACYATGVLLLIFQRDGYAFQFLWPNAPKWNDYSSLPLGASLPILAAIFARTYLNTRALHPQIEKVLIGVGAVHILMIASSAVIGASAAKQISLITVSISIAIFISIGVVAYRHYGKRTLFFLIGWLGLLLGTLIMTTVHWFEVDITRAQSLNVMRVSMVFDALMMGFAAVFLVVDLQRDHEKLSQDRIRILDANLKLHERFSRLEQNYQIAQALAQSSSHTLADVTHDLRQPLFALKSAIRSAVAGEAGALSLKDIESSFTYIESLVDGALQSAIDQDELVENAEQDVGSTEINEIFSAMEAMFKSDALERDVDLRVVSCDLEVAIPPFVTLRILSNLASNAVRYSPGARVLIGARRRGSHLSLEVHDSGPGMPVKELERCRERLARGEVEAEGYGLGLAIVARLAAEHDLTWHLNSLEGKGTWATVLVPVA